jgi:tetratricopeptide (TPR) repeat protein
MSANRSLDSESAPRGRSLKTLTISLAIASVLLVLGIASRPRPGENAERLRQDATKAAEQGRWNEAEAILSRVTDPTPADWLLRALVATSLNQPDAAIDFLAKIPPDGPLAARVALVASRAELGRFRARPMEDALHRALRLDPKLAEARRSLIYLYGVQGRRLELLDQFAALAEQGSLSFELVKNWCIAHQEQIQEPDKLKSTLEHFVKNDPDDRWSRLGLARVYRRLGQFDRSRECLAPLPDSDPEARAGRAEVEFDRGNLEEVTALLADGPADHPKLARLRGQVALNRQDGPSALKFFRLSDAAEPNHGETLYGLAQALRIVGDRAAAEPYSRRASAQRAFRDQLTNMTDNHDSKAVFCRRLASECEAAGYLLEARAWYRLAVIADPSDVEAQESVLRLSSTGSRPEGTARPSASANISKTN